MSNAFESSQRTQLSIIDDPINVGPRTLRSRVYVPAHQPGLADSGAPGSRYVAYHRRLARAGVGMQITGATPVLASGLWRPERSLVNLDESIVPGYQRLADGVHAGGGVILAQLAHAGPTDEGGDVIGPSWTVSELTGEVSRVASDTDLAVILEAYAAAADRCRRGDLDGVEITMAHGLLLAAFLSPILNMRDDAYGGSVEERLRFPIAVLAEVRRNVGPDRILGVRLCADDMIKGGLDKEQAAEIATHLNSTGLIDYISVIAGNNTRLLPRVKHWPPTPAPHGLFRDLARCIKLQMPTLPVCCVGRVTTLDLARDIISSGDADLVGMVRAHIADPELLPKARAGREGEIAPCIGANNCIDLSLNHQAVSCIINPRIVEPLDTAPVSVDRTAVVFGGGPAGLEVARRLAAVGIQTTLYEQQERLGGQLTLWSQLPSWTEYSKLLRWWESELDRVGVTTKLGVAGTASEAIGADLAVVATGSVAHSGPDLGPDSELPIESESDVLGGKPMRGRVLVFDAVGRLDALAVAEKALENGADEVVFVTSKVHVGEGQGITTLYPALERIQDLRITLIERFRPVKARGNRVVLKSMFGESERTQEADVAIMCVGHVPVNQLAIDLSKKGAPAVEIVGDAWRPRRIRNAVDDAIAVVERAKARASTVPSRNQ